MTLSINLPSITTLGILLKIIIISIIALSILTVSVVYPNKFDTEHKNTLYKDT